MCRLLHCCHAPLHVSGVAECDGLLVPAAAELARHVCELKAQTDAAKGAAHLLYASATNADLLRHLSALVQGILAAQRDIRWAQIVGANACAYGA